MDGVAPQQVEENLTGIVQRARTKVPGITVIVAGMQMPPNLGAKFVEQFGAVFPRVAATQRAMLVPFLLESVGGISALNQDDLIHPNPAGVRIIANRLAPTIARALRTAPARA